MAVQKQMNSAAADAPFFIVGCVRSGTTLLRDLLRLHPRLDCPEETHFFRWGDPFGTPRFNQIYSQNLVLKKQRDIDGIDETLFQQIIAGASSRRELAEAYGRTFLQQTGGKRRWFDKSPQNVYGMLLISAVFPSARFVHIHRNPLNVVASLLAGQVMPAQPLIGAINYWVEAMAIVDQYQTAWPERVLEISYERFTENPMDGMQRILAFVGESDPLPAWDPDRIYPEKNAYRHMLSQDQIREVIDACQPYYAKYYGSFR